MIFNSFRIYNYKSIEDSGICFFAHPITILAGKNEAGKTAILEALFDYHPENNGFDENAIPKKDENAKPKVEIEFEIEDSDRESIVDELDAWDTHYSVLADLKHVKILKHYNNKYQILEINRESAEGNSLLVDHPFLKILAMESITSGILSRKQYDDEKLPVAGTYYKNGIGWSRWVSDYLGALEEYLLQAYAGADNTKQNIIAIFSRLENIDDEYDKAIDKFLSVFIELIPPIILFSSFEKDLLPSSIDIANAKNNLAVADLTVLTGLDIDRLASTADEQRRQTTTRTISTKITGDFKDFWHQDEIKIDISMSGNTLYFWFADAQDQTVVFTLEQRSKGLQWFVSFYLRLQARAPESKSLILIDEPGLYLHAKAQRDVLEVMHSLTKQHQVAFTTHSPYLIQPDDIGLIRPVVKKQTKTIIENKIHRELDEDTLTPVITSLINYVGLDISKNLTFPYKNNLLVEGMSDYYVLHGIANTFGYQTEGIGIIPSQGAPTIHLLCSLMIGWDLNFKVLLDSDGAGNKARKTLISRFGLDDEKIIMVSDKKNNSIEDLFAREDFRRLLPDDVEFEDNLINSKMISKLDKVRIFKDFYEKSKTASADMSAETKANFSHIFEALSMTGS